MVEKVKLENNRCEFLAEVRKDEMIISIANYNLLTGAGMKLNCGQAHLLYLFLKDQFKFD